MTIKFVLILKKVIFEKKVMKKLVLTVLAVATIMFVFTSCKKDVEKQIVGKWKITSVKVLGSEKTAQDLAKSMGVPDDQIQSYVDQMKKEMDDNYKSSFENAVIEFTADHKAITSENANQQEDWIYDKDKDKIIINPNSSSPTDFIIESINSDKMKAKMISGNKSSEVEIEMEFEKQK